MKYDQMELYYARKAVGRCPNCGKEATDNHILCEKCRTRMRANYYQYVGKMTPEQRAELNAKSSERQKNKREQMRAQGRCAICGAPSPDMHTCESCRAKRRAQEAARKGRLKK